MDLRIQMRPTVSFSNVNPKIRRQGVKASIVIVLGSSRLDPSHKMSFEPCRAFYMMIVKREMVS